MKKIWKIGFRKKYFNFEFLIFFRIFRKKITYYFIKNIIDTPGIRFKVERKGCVFVALKIQNEVKSKNF